MRRAKQKPAQRPKQKRFLCAASMMYCVLLPFQDRLPQNVIDDINAALGAAREAKDLDDAAAIRQKASALQQARVHAPNVDSSILTRPHSSHANQFKLTNEPMQCFCHDL